MTTATPHRKPALCFRLAVLLGLAFLFLPSVAFAAAGVFNFPERKAGSGDYQRHFQPLWERVLAAEKARASFTADGRNLGPVDAATWRNLVKAARHDAATDTLRMVNGYFNQWRPKSDDQAWSTQEYWATPAEFISQRGGDCEDYAIAKYYALRFLGFESSRLRIVLLYMKDGNGKILPGHHAVLAARANNTWFVLDNNARPRDGIFPHTQYNGRFVPIYSFNEIGAWEHDGR